MKCFLRQGNLRIDWKQPQESKIRFDLSSLVEIWIFAVKFYVHLNQRNKFRRENFPSAESRSRTTTRTMFDESLTTNLFDDQMMKTEFVRIENETRKFSSKPLKIEKKIKFVLFVVQKKKIVAKRKISQIERREFVAKRFSIEIREKRKSFQKSIFVFGSFDSNNGRTLFGGKSKLKTTWIKRIFPDQRFFVEFRR